jgi:alkylated DNA repair dioxygenase AlkB
VSSKIKTRRRQPEAPSPIRGSSINDNNPLSSSSTTPLSASQKLKKAPSLTKAGSNPDLEGTKSKNYSPNITIIKGNEPAGSNESRKTMIRKSEDESVRTPAAEETLVPLCEGDTTVINNLLSGELSQGVFEKVRDEVRWQTMSHQGGEVPRLVSVQGKIGEDGSIPIYRHPADESPPLLPFSPVVAAIRTEVEKKLGHSLNHVLIQLYRDGTDYISEHSDKTLDIAPNTFIANVSLGAQRTMVFRTKKHLKSDGETKDTVEPRKAYRAPLPHNSMCKMGLVTNMRWLHGIRQDKRMTTEKSESELAYNGCRISLTFRSIGTFLDKDNKQIWGQGATSKRKEIAKTVINGNTPEAEQMIRAFGKENHSSEFDWVEHYGSGFDVLHMSNSPKLFLSGDSVADLIIKLLLAEYGVAWTEGKVSPSFNWKGGNSGLDRPAIPENLPVKFVDNDLSKSTVIGDKAIMLYLDSVYGPLSKAPSRAELARIYTRSQQSAELLRSWRAVPFSARPFHRELDFWEAYAMEDTFIAGSEVSLADFSLFPILVDVASQWGPECNRLGLKRWYLRMMELETTKKVMGL